MKSIPLSKPRPATMDLPRKKPGPQPLTPNLTPKRPSPPPPRRPGSTPSAMVMKKGGKVKARGKK